MNLGLKGVCFSGSNKPLVKRTGNLKTKVFNRKILNKGCGAEAQGNSEFIVFEVFD